MRSVRRLLMMAAAILALTLAVPSVSASTHKAFHLDKKIDGRGMTYYSLANGKIVEDDPIETPDLLQELAALMPPPSA